MNTAINTPTNSPVASVELRLATDEETELIRQLAELDDARVLDGQALLALHDGRAVAALALQDGRVVADPFVLTGEAVAMLRLHARHLTAPRRKRRVRLILRARLA